MLAFLYPRKSSCVFNMPSNRVCGCVLGRQLTFLSLQWGGGFCVQKCLKSNFRYLKCGFSSMFSCQSCKHRRNIHLLNIKHWAAVGSTSQNMIQLEKMQLQAIKSFLNSRKELWHQTLAPWGLPCCQPPCWGKPWYLHPNQVWKSRISFWKSEQASKSHYK